MDVEDHAGTLDGGTTQDGAAQDVAAKPSSGQSLKLPQSLSPSGASTFRQCARRWKYRYIDKLPDPPGEAALRGTFVHQVLEELLAALPAQRTAELARSICRDQWPRFAMQRDFVALDLPADQQRAFRWNAWTDIEGYFGLVDPQAVEVVDRERDVRTSLDGVPFRGIIDLVERDRDGLCVTDYKTGRPPSKRYVDSRLAQVWLYAAALSCISSDSEDVSGVRLLYLGETGAGIERRRPIEITRRYDADAVDAAVAEHRATWVQIGKAAEVGEFEPSPGPLCGWCAYREECPEGQAEYQRRTELAA